jgi:hypothetical protein
MDRRSRCHTPVMVPQWHRFSGRKILKREILKEAILILDHHAAVVRNVLPEMR